MPISAHMEPSHHLHSHGTSGLEHHSSSACVIDCLSPSNAMPFGKMHCNSTNLCDNISQSFRKADFKYPSLNNNQICSKLPCSVDRSLNSSVHTITSSLVTISSSAPYNNSPVTLVSTTAYQQSPSDSDSPPNDSKIESSKNENLQVCAYSSQAEPPLPNQNVETSSEQSICDSQNAKPNVFETAVNTSDETLDDDPLSVEQSKSSDSSVRNEAEESSSVMREKLCEVNHDENDTEINNEDDSCNVDNSEIHHPSNNNNSSSLNRLDNTIESVLDKIRTGRGEEVEFDVNSRSQEFPSTHSSDSPQSLNNSGSQQLLLSPTKMTSSSTFSSSVSQWSQSVHSSPKECSREDVNFKHVNKIPTTTIPLPNSQIIPNGSDPGILPRNLNASYPMVPRHQIPHNLSRMPYGMFHQSRMYQQHQNMPPVNHPNFMQNYTLSPNHYPPPYQTAPNNLNNYNNSNYYGSFNCNQSSNSFYLQRNYECMVGGGPQNKTPNSYPPKQSMPHQPYGDVYKPYGNNNPPMYQYNQMRPMHSIQPYDSSLMNPQMIHQGFYNNYMIDCNMKNQSQSIHKSTHRKRNILGDKNKLGPLPKKKKADDHLSFDTHEALLQKLAFPNFQNYIQEPLVEPPLFLAIPKGGSYSCKNDVDTAEEASELLIEKKKKYELTPFALKLCRSNSPLKEDSFILQSIKNCGDILKLPSKPIFSKPILFDRSSTPDYLVCASPFNSDINFDSNSSIPSLKALESESPDSRACTPQITAQQHSLKRHVISPVCPTETFSEIPNHSNEGSANFEDNSKSKFSHDDFNGFCSASDVDPFAYKPFDGYAEQSTSIRKLLKHTEVGKCDICNSLIVDWQYIQKICDDNSESSPVKKLFCSVSCLANHTKKSLSSVETNETDYTSEYVQELSLDSTNIISRILIKGPIPKLFKKPAKRALERRTTFHAGIGSKENLNKRWKEVRYKRFRKHLFPLKNSKISSNSDYILNASPSLKVKEGTLDSRMCQLCHRIGDSSEKSAGRLINHDVDDWLHVNCALWCYEVYETISGALVDPNGTSYTRAANTKCHFCGQYGAGLPCYKSRCTCIYHVPCAQEAGCMFFTDRGMYCPMHKLASDHPLHMPDISANRRIYLDRESSILVGNAILNSNSSKSQVIRCGALILCSIGKLSPVQMLSGNFNDDTSIFPDGYRVLRIYWSTYEINKRCMYECCVIDKNHCPFFIVRRLLNGRIVEENLAASPDLAWKPYLEKIATLRENAKLIRLYPQLLKGKDLFGLTDSHIIRACESLPNIEILPKYIFRYGRLQTLNDHEPPEFFCLSGSARLENRYTVELCHRSSRWSRSRFAAPTTVNVLQNSSTGRQNSMTTNLDYGAPQSKLNKLQLFKRLTVGYEWKSNVYFAPSKYHGMGLFAARSMDKHTMIIELVGELIRDQVAIQREKFYKSKHRRNIMLMQVQKGLVLDATRSGNLSRFVRHSCSPNCVSELLIIDSKPHIVLSAGRAITACEELTFDFKVDQCAAENSWQLLEPYQGPPKIPCFCGASTCKKWIS